MRSSPSSRGTASPAGSADRWHKRSADYDEFKQRLQDRLLAQFLAKMPALRDAVDSRSSCRRR
ncbi:MAG: hypothetical protein IPO88_32320 [Nannocystis sp.]|uniref:hypothetical protein n=1 Tax=Nannocystis sp. TaxID=1962667 RepID=UPI002420DED5|nr:hypothetical protein [Nannocystis sp.]MBK9758121.1 hypothetical protein [Nannocystis sp.]